MKAKVTAIARGNSNAANVRDQVGEPRAKKAAKGKAKATAKAKAAPVDGDSSVGFFSPVAYVCAARPMCFV